MKNPDQEHILLVDENGKFELQGCEQINSVAQGHKNIRAFVFERSGKTTVVFWHTSGEGKLKLDIDPSKVHLFKEFGKEIPVTQAVKGVVVPLGDRHYLEMDLSKEEAVAIYRNAIMLVSTK